MADSSSSTDPGKKQYDSFAPKYLSVEQLPCSQIEAQLIRIALGDCTGLHVLDLGGGNGLHARRAVNEANAASVDVVDISREMLRIGHDLEIAKEKESGASSRIRWFEADLTKPLSEKAVLPLESTPDTASPALRPEGYDIVMANWLFDHATSLSDLRQMYANIASQLKPHGGRFLGVRVHKIHAPYITNGNGKYGALFKDIERIEGEPGYKYECGMQLSEDGEAFYFGATSMDQTLELKDGEEGGVGREAGLTQYWVVPPEETQVAKDDPGYWEDFLTEPNLAVVVARKP